MRTLKELREFAQKRFDDLDNRSQALAYWDGYLRALESVERNGLVKQPETEPALGVERDALKAENETLELQNDRFRDALLRFPERMTLDKMLREITLRYPDDPYASFLTEQLSAALHLENTNERND